MGFGDVKEGLRFCSLEVVGDEGWIDEVKEESKVHYSPHKTCKFLTTSVIFFLQL